MLILWGENLPSVFGTVLCNEMFKDIWLDSIDNINYM